MSKDSCSKLQTASGMTCGASLWHLTWYNGQTPPCLCEYICIKTPTINVHKPMGCMSAMSHPTQNCCISVIISIHLNKFICACFTASVEMSVLRGNMKRSPSEICNCVRQMIQMLPYLDSICWQHSAELITCMVVDSGGVLRA